MWKDWRLRIWTIAETIMLNGIIIYKFEQYLKNELIEEWGLNCGKTIFGRRQGAGS